MQHWAHFCILNAKKVGYKANKIYWNFFNLRSNKKKVPENAKRRDQSEDFDLDMKERLE
jgi:hypothetical protein